MVTCHGFAGCKLTLIALCLIVSSQCLGKASVQVMSEAIEHQKISLIVGKTIVIKSPQAIKRISMAASGKAQGVAKIAEAVLVTPPDKGAYPQEIVLVGKAPGTTNLTLWGKDNEISAVLDLEVSPDISLLKARLNEILPEEKDVRTTANDDSIILSGTVSSLARLSQILALAESHVANKDKVINMLEVAGVHQVMLEVRISEISKSLMQKLGFNFNFFKGGDFGVSLLNNLTSLPGAIPSSAAPSAVAATSSINGIFRFHQGGGTWTGFIDALKENGLVKVLAEPTLIALSGQSASFLAGGEFPIPVPQVGAQGGSVTIAYKQYGVGLVFTPTVMSSGKISMKVAPEVSELDFSNAVYISGYVVPALTTRRVSTVIELADGQSFAIAGLIKESAREVVSKFPLLGDIPILGVLFRSSQFQKNESELVIIVTPHLVKPLDPASQTLPTDQYVEPNDFEFYLMGAMEGKGKSPAQKNQGGMDGDFGHVIP